MQQRSCPGCAELAMQGSERDVQLLGLLPVADAGARSTPQCVRCGWIACLWHGLGAAAFVLNWTGSRHASVKVETK